jgi:hypothetical protein
VGDKEKHADGSESEQGEQDLEHPVLGIGQLGKEYLEEGNVQEGAARDAL